jgi:hypothetical protein
MGDGANKAAALLDIALATYKDEIQPGLEKDKRYTGAMIANALGMAERRLTHDDPEAALVERFGAESLSALAASIRSCDISGASYPALAQELLDHVRAELAITNPRFLARREGESDA